MKLPVIKQLSEQYTLDILRKAEEDLLETGTPGIVVDGDDDLTEQEAKRRVAWIQAKANESSREIFLRSYLMMDENLPTKEVPALDKGYGLPGSYTDFDRSRH